MLNQPMSSPMMKMMLGLLLLLRRGLWCRCCRWRRLRLSLRTGHDRQRKERNAAQENIAATGVKIRLGAGRCVLRCV